jgi:hypothetical protein
MALDDQIKELHSQGISKARACLQLGIQRWHLDQFIEAMGLDWKPRIRGGSFVIDGVTDTLQGHSERLGVSVGKIRWRLKQNMPVVAPAAYTPISLEEVELYLKLRKSGMTNHGAASQVGRPYNTLRNAAKRFFPDRQQAPEARIQPIQGDGAHADDLQKAA